MCHNLTLTPLQLRAKQLVIVRPERLDWSEIITIVVTVDFNNQGTIVPPLCISELSTSTQSVPIILLSR